MANRFLSNITINDSYTFPSADGASGQVISTDGAGNLSFVDQPTEALTLNLTVKNVSGGSLAKGTIVHASPSATPPSGNVVEVISADYDDSAKMPAIGILNETLANEAEGQAIMFGAVSGIDTSSFSAGDELWVGDNGAFTNTKPATAGQLIQKIAVVIKSHASNGLIKVFGAGRTNDVPLPLYIDDANQRVGIGTATPSQELTVEGNIELGTGGYIYGDTTSVSLRLNDAAGAFLNYGVSSLVNGGSLQFQTDSGVVFRINKGGGGYINGGNVGIGTTTPSTKLHIYESAATAAISIQGGSSSTSDINLGDVDDINIGRIRYLHGSNSLTFDTNNAERMRINASGDITIGGKLGIGTTPSDKLDVSGNIKLVSTGDYLKFANDFVTVKRESNLLSFNAYSGFKFYDTQATSERMRIDSNGNVGIGTTDPKFKLDIGGDSTSTDNTVRITQGSGGTAIRIGAGGGGNDVVLLRVDGDGAANSLGKTDLGSYGFSFKYFGSGSGNANRFGILTDNQSSGTQLEAISILQDANVGIGTVSPQAKLDVSGDIYVRNGAALYTDVLAGFTSGVITLNSNTNFIVPSGSLAIGTTVATYPFTLESAGTGLISRFYNSNADGQGVLIRAGATTSPTRVLQVASSNDTKIMTVTSNGRVGVGTTNPLTELHVKGTNGWGEIRVEGQTFASGHGGALEFYSEATALADIYANTNKQLVFRTNGTTETMRLTHSGFLGIGTTNPQEKLDVNGRVQAQRYRTTTAGDETFAAYYFLGDSDTGLFQPSTNMLAITTAGSEKVRIDSTGNVGIGTTSPSEKLEVNGAVKITNVGAAQLILRGDSNNTDDAGQVDGVIDFLHDDGGFGYRLNTENYVGKSAFNIQEHINGTLTSRLYIDLDGNVGINTVDPKQKFHVSGGTASGDVTKVVIGATGGNAESYLYLAEQWQGNDVSYGFSFVADGNSSNNLLIKRHSNSTSGSTVITVNRDDNNVSFAGSIDVNNAITAGTISVGDTIVHTGDTDTKIEFLSNQIKTTVGNTLAINTISTGTQFYQDVIVSGALKGPSTFYIDPSPDDTGEPGGATTDTGTVVILGDLQVTGTTTTIDSTTLNVGDLNIVLAKDATTAAAANGAGITINGANATLTYASATDDFTFNKDLNVNGNLRLNNNSQLRFKNSVGTEIGVMTFNASNELILFNGNSSSGDIIFKDGGATGTTNLTIDGATGNVIANNSVDILTGNLQMGSTTVIDSNRNVFATNVNSTYLNVEAGSPTLVLKDTTDDDDHSILFNNSLGTTDYVIKTKDITSAAIGDTFQLGSVTSEELTFITNNTIALTIDTSQNVGIGTTSPVSNLTVDGGTGIYVRNSSGGTLVFDDTDVADTSTPMVSIRGIDGNTIFSTANRNSTSGLTTGTTERMRITSGGQVGINESSPLDFLHIAPLTGDSRYVRTYLPDSTVYNNGSYNTEERVASGLRFGWYSEYWQIGAARGGSTDVDGLIFSRNGDERLVLREDGNVGIGTVSPSRRLSVAGSIELTSADTTINTAHAGIRRGASGEMFLDAPGDITVTIDTNNNNTDRVFNVRKDTGTELFRIQENGNVGIGTTSPTAKLEVNGSIKHDGLTPTSGSNIDQITEITKSLQLTAGTWTDTGISGTDIGANGVYILYMLVDDYNVGGGHYSEIYSATMSWRASNTNSTLTDEIYLHRAGHAPNSGVIQLRTVRQSSSVMKLQIKSNSTYSAADNIVFKFRRMI